ncbi:hypothetical protein ECZU45_10740 [Escherichia coli]|nr:hypothetical protein ECZU45_10740 [Escherichia coli]
MDHAIYTAMGAASQTLNQQAVTASNLANASTPGFRAQLNALRAVPVEGLSAYAHVGHGVNAGRRYDARQNGLHLAPAGRRVAAGWLAGRADR